MKNLRLLFLLFSAVMILYNPVFSQEDFIPLPEHPRPDFWRQHWENLNGYWDFIFEKDNDAEIDEMLQLHEISLAQSETKKIIVPFPWGSPLSEVPDSADIGWYHREVIVPENWEAKRVFLVIGASDWHTSAWLDGEKLGDHKGGYTPFEFELTDHISYGKPHSLWIRVDDTEYPFKLYGKQGYGNARGIWQTVYLEARGQDYVDYVHASPDIDNSIVEIKGALGEVTAGKTEVEIKVKGDQVQTMSKVIELEEGSVEFNTSFNINNQKLWTLENPFLYDLQVTIRKQGTIVDQLNSYFGMRKISVMNMPGTDISYVALNNKPVYLEMSLDQAYHPEGYYTFPSDEFMRNEIIRSKKIGLNGQRIHVKIGIPRKLYWADKLGMLIMADVPNSWGEPDEDMQRETEYALEQMIRRDFNHPSIFSWVIFNETWGLFTRQDEGRRQYLEPTQKWVSGLYYHAKEMDSTRLVEDNSACNYDHVSTDINTWHAYLPGYAWEDRLDQFSEETYPGSGWNFVEGYTQKNQPNINSECGNVWGYEGSTGDVDWSWDYHQMINAFRKHPTIGGWLYTEHHDVINEWNGYYRYDRSEKETGLGAFNGMTLNDLHYPIQVTPDIDLCVDKNSGEAVEIPLYLSAFTEKIPANRMLLKYFISWVNELGEKKQGKMMESEISIKPWMHEYLDPIKIILPGEAGLAVLNLQLETPSGNVIQKNFTTFRMKDDHMISSDQFSYFSFTPSSFTSSEWSLKQWNILEGKKVNGAGNGYFMYDIEIPEEILIKNIQDITFRAEISAKKLYGKDKEGKQENDGDYMRGRGMHDPSLNPNAYPMTDEYTFPSMVRVIVNDQVIDEIYLEDDPADHRGVLSWHAQLKDRKLREAGSYGYLVDVTIPTEMVKNSDKLSIRLEVPEGVDGGLAIYGKEFGRYPLDPMLIFYHEK